MINLALGFVFGAWLLQQQPVLDINLLALQASWILAPSLIVFSKFKHHLVKKISLFVFAGLLGFFWAALFATIRLSDELPKDWEQKSVEIIGVVASLPEVTERGERFRFDVEKILTKEAKIPQHVSLNFYRETESAKPENAPALTNYFHAGERWEFTVRLKRPHSTYNPHGFDFEGWALAQNMRATGAIRNKSGYKKLSNFVFKPSYLIENAREKVGNKITQTLANKPYAGVIRALVVGDDSQITQAQWDVFFKTGVGHLVSISGLHITMLAGLAFAITAFIWRRFPSLVMRLPTGKAATIAGVFVALLYAGLAGWSVPTQRTIFMLLTFAAALLLASNLAISRVLAIALIVVVLCDPWAVIAPGFWLSFGAVALIACVTVSRLKAANWLKTAIATQWAITLGLLPLLIVMFGQTSIVSPLANAFAIPIISLLVVPLAIFGSLLHLDFVLQLSHWILEMCMHGLNYLAKFQTWQQAAPPMWTLLVAMFGVLWMLLPRGFPQRWLGLIFLLPLFLVEIPRPEIGEMQVAVLDVGQGLAVVIQTKNHTFLYDAGSRYSAQSDAGHKIVVPYLRGEGIAKLDGFIVSHDDIDHSGGAASVLAQVPVTWLASSFDLVTGNLPKKTMKCFSGQHWRWDGVSFEVLYPSLESYENAEIKDNNRSCVVKVTSQFGSVLLTGDVEKEAEKEILDHALGANGPDHLLSNSLCEFDSPCIHAASSDAVLSNDLLKSADLQSDVLVVPHHGSKTSSTVDFVQAVGAKNIIFTVGYLNRFKHPKPLIEKRFEESGANIYRSDYQGAVLIDFKKFNVIKIEAWRQTQPRYWHGNYVAKY